MTRAAAISAATGTLDDGSLLALLARRVAVPTASQDADSEPHLWRYLEQEIAPDLTRIGFTCTVHHLDAKVGGSFKMSFRNFSTGNGHSFGGEYLELVPGEAFAIPTSSMTPICPARWRCSVLKMRLVRFAIA